jgi:hypothetical protein
MSVMLDGAPRFLHCGWVAERLFCFGILMYCRFLRIWKDAQVILFLFNIYLVLAHVLGNLFSWSLVATPGSGLQIHWNFSSSMHSEWVKYYARTSPTNDHILGPLSTIATEPDDGLWFVVHPQGSKYNSGVLYIVLSPSFNFSPLHKYELLNSWGVVDARGWLGFFVQDNKWSLLWGSWLKDNPFNDLIDQCGCKERSILWISIWICHGKQLNQIPSSMYHAVEKCRPGWTGTVWKWWSSWIRHA